MDKNATRTQFEYLAWESKLHNFSIYVSNYFHTAVMN